MFGNTAADNVDPNNQVDCWRREGRTIPFVSKQPKVGDPPLRWAAFENPKLRRFPGPSDFQLEDYLGGGEDGFVFKAHIEEQGPVAVKVVSLRVFYLLDLR